MTEHWLKSYIGKPWLLGGRGPDAFDCWGVVWWFNKERGINLPVVAQNACQTYQQNCLLMQHEIDGVLKARLARRLDAPVDGCTVLLSKNSLFTHAGLYADVDGGRIVHALPGTGVVAEPVWSMNARGWRKILYYAHD